LNDASITSDDDPSRYLSHDGKKWLVHAEDGSILGEHDNPEDAKKQLAAIEISKNKAKKAEKGANSMILTPEKRVLLPFDAELRVKKEPDGQRRIVGYAAKFGKLSQNLGGFQEKIHEKAFERALKTADVRALRNHDPDKLLGRTKSGTLNLEVDDVGLRYDIAVPDTVVGRDTITDIERGDLDGSSFSFTADDGGDEWDDSTSPPTRTLMNIRDLFDVGPVTYPAYLDTEAYARNCRSYQQHIANPQRVIEEQKRAAQARRMKLLEFKLGVKLT
jgi:uncharacterized protein